MADVHDPETTDLGAVPTQAPSEAKKAEPLNPRDQHIKDVQSLFDKLVSALAKPLPPRTGDASLRKSKAKKCKEDDEPVEFSAKEIVPAVQRHLFSWGTRTLKNPTKTDPKDPKEKGIPHWHKPQESTFRNGGDPVCVHCFETYTSVSDIKCIYIIGVDKIPSLLFRLLPRGFAICTSCATQRRRWIPPPTTWLGALTFKIIQESETLMNQIRKNDIKELLIQQQEHQQTVMDERLAELKADSETKRDRITDLTKQLEALEIPKAKLEQILTERTQEIADLRSKVCLLLVEADKLRAENDRKLENIKADFVEQISKMEKLHNRTLDQMSRDFNERRKATIVALNEIPTKPLYSKVCSSETSSGETSSGATAVTDELTDDDRYSCKICKCDRASFVLLPCMHVVACQDCVEPLKSSTNTCPVCRTGWSQCKKIFF